jgi:mRNA-degrading endonuclease toxin of MazEF toxin-antitoxin module
MKPKIERGEIWWNNLDQLPAVDDARFVSKQGRLSTSDMNALESAIKRVLELP